MSSLPASEPMSPEESTSLTEFARTCKAAVRAVSLYPEAHPTIQASLARVLSATTRLASDGDLVLTVLPDALAVGGRTPTRPDSAVTELAAVMHQQLIATLKVERAAGPGDWHALLLLLGRPTEELIAEGGVGKVWAAGGHDHFEIREIDYAEVLRERPGGEAADWDDLIARCVQGDTPDEHSLATLVEVFADPPGLAEFLERFQVTAEAGGSSVSERAAATLRLLRQVLNEGASHAPSQERILKGMAEHTAALTPDMLMALLEAARSGDAGQLDTMADVVDRIEDATVASFVANSVLTEGGASERLATAFQVLVPETSNRERTLDLARMRAASDPRAQETGFEDLWHHAADMLTSYSDDTYVSSDYGSQLSAARTRAVEVERVSDDPPERVSDWLSTVSDGAIQRLDLDLLLDLLRIESDVAGWTALAAVARLEVESRAARSDITGAAQLVDAIKSRSTGEDDELTAASDTILTALADGELAQSLMSYLREAPDGAGVEAVGHLSGAIGPRLAGPLTEALTTEDDTRTVGRVRELLLRFGASGLSSVEQLTESANPAVRRVAIDLLRAVGNQEALPELVSLLDDPDSTVRREALRALVDLGTSDAFTTLERRLSGEDRSAAAALQPAHQSQGAQCGSPPRTAADRFASRWPVGSRPRTQVIDALGGLGAHPSSASALEHALYAGTWWTPFRTAALRRALALRRIASPDARRVLEEATAHGSRAVRRAVASTSHKGDHR